MGMSWHLRASQREYSGENQGLRLSEGGALVSSAWAPGSTDGVRTWT